MEEKQREQEKRSDNQERRLVLLERIVWGMPVAVIACLAFIEVYLRFSPALQAASTVYNGGTS